MSGDFEPVDPVFEEASADRLQEAFEEGVLARFNGKPKQSERLDLSDDEFRQFCAGYDGADEPPTGQFDAQVAVSPEAIDEQIAADFGVPQLTARRLLLEAAGIQDQRAQQYDQPSGERSMADAVAALEILWPGPMTEVKGWLLQVMIKIVRARNAPRFHRDSWVDGASYVSLAGEADARARP
jgi:hypothetical protein